MKTAEAKQQITQLLTQGGFQIDDITFEERGEGEHYINVISKADAVALIGRGGEGLLALQHLVKVVLRAQGLVEDQDFIKVDIDSCRSRQEANVMEMANRKAEQVMKTGRSETLPPMSSFFRRLVHLNIKEKYPELSTFSQGEGNFRSVCITKVGAEQDNNDVPADLYTDLGF